MRSNLFTKTLPTAVLGAVLLSGLGAQSAVADGISTGSASTAGDDAEARFLEMADLFSQSCAPDVFSHGLGSVAATTAVEPPPDTTMPVPDGPVPLTAEEKCVAQRHQLRISRAFSGTDTTTYEEMRAELTSLRYPAARIHRMPDFSGEPVARLDLRAGAGRLALEVTGLGNGVMVEAFGAPDGVSVTGVRLERRWDPPSS